MEDFNVHRIEWLNSNTTDLGGREAFNFPISHELEHYSTPYTCPRSPWWPSKHSRLILYLQYSTLYLRIPAFSRLFGSISCQCLLFFCISTTITSRPTSSYLSDSTQHTELSSYFLDFPWEDYCFCSGDPDTVAPLVTDVIVSGMEAYVPFSIKTFSPSKPWFDHACFLAVQARERAFRSYRSSPSALTHAAFISARNRCKSITRKAKTSFGKKKVESLTRSPTEKAFWFLAKKFSKNFCNSSFPPLFCPDGSITCSPTDKATLFGSLFSANSSVDDYSAPEPPPLPFSNPMSPLLFPLTRCEWCCHPSKWTKHLVPALFLPDSLRNLRLSWLQFFVVFLPHTQNLCLP